MKIHAVNRNYTGTSAGVAFQNGTGETDNPILLEWFRTHGYSVEGDTVEGDTVEKTVTDKTEKADRKTGTKKAGE